MLVPAWAILCLPSNLERHSLSRYRLVAPRGKEGPDWAALATSERRSIVVDEPVNLIKGNVLSLVNDEQESVKRRHRFLKTFLSD